MRILAWFAFLFFLHGVHSFFTDMGDCGCVCGLQPVEDNGTSVTTPSFYDRVRGPKGYPGNTGKFGPQGPQGLQGEQGPAGPPGVSTVPGGNNAESCMEYRASGITKSGIYKIKSNGMSATAEVYCDMETAGGGWTLVASVHENNIKGKCTLGDNWSSDQNATSKSYNGTRNWENFNTFGRPVSATSDDYKSSAYFNLVARDVMIWHVPNDIEVSEWSNQAFLKYYTNTGFLSDYGGTLQSVFSKYFPVNVVPSEEGSAFQGVWTILEALNVSAPSIRSAVSRFYSYTYDFGAGTVQNYISDGGRDMFDTGNKVSYQIGSNGFRQITYRTVYKETSGVEISSSTEHPFIALMWIGNSERTTSTFDLKVESGTGADGNGYYATYTGTINHQSFSLQYKSYHVYDANDPAISEVFFLIESSEHWGSISPSSFNSISWSSATDNLVNTMRVSGSPRSVMMGYTLLSRTDDRLIPNSDVRSALTRILETVSRFQSISNQNCNRTSESLVVPINYIAGGNQTVLSHIPPRLRNSVTPGFIQFRPLSSSGIPSAICPGIKTDTCRPSTVCIGGINTLSVHSQYASECGDFGAWDGANADLPTATAPDGLAHSLNDIASSILIFTRSETRNQFN